jgi:hypothetical protein
MKNAVHSWVHTLKRHWALSKADESLACSDKTWQFLQTCIIMFKKQVQLLCLLSLNKCTNKTNYMPLVCKRTIPTERPPLVSEVSASDRGCRVVSATGSIVGYFLLFIFISTTCIIKFSIPVLSCFFWGGGYFLLH